MTAMVRLGVMKGEFHWHKHDGEDEFFYVIDRRFIIDLEDRVVELAPKRDLPCQRCTAPDTRGASRDSDDRGHGVIPTGD
jgi:hypothetical protein